MSITTVEVGKFPLIRGINCGRFMVLFIRSSRRGKLIAGREKSEHVVSSYWLQQRLSGKRYKESFRTMAIFF